MLHGIVYRSEAKLPEDDVSNLDILRASLVNNPRLELTGFLLRDRGRFLQAIEGPRRAVIAMMERISRDGRHRSVTVLGEGPVAARRFGAWSMGYAGLDLRGGPGIVAMSRARALQHLLDVARRQAAAEGGREGFSEAVAAGAGQSAP